MKRIVLIMILIAGASLYGQELYLIPDIGAPGMNVYVEIMAGPNDRQFFGTDAIVTNNPTDAYRVEPETAEDAEKITIGPLSISWDGRMISTQIFVHPGADPDSWDWEAVDDEYKIRLKIYVNNVLIDESRWPTFYVVQPFEFGDQSAGSVSWRLGNNRWGKRSPRGAMVVDSMILPNRSVKVDLSDTDDNLDGNQAYLPFVLLSKGPIKGGSGSRINLTGNIPEDGHGGNAAPGGGGGGGKFCDYTGLGSVNPAAAGSGFVAGGHGGTNNSTSGSGSYDDYGVGTGPGDGNRGGLLGNSINGVQAPEAPFNWEASAGGTGHPFGTSGVFSVSGGSNHPEGGYGGGTGYQDSHGGGGGGYATPGDNASGDANDVSGGKIHGNSMVVPIAGGSGGASGNPRAIINSTCAGSGGGAGGACRIYAPQISNLLVTANGGDGSSGSGGRAGGGSGGHVGIFTKLQNTDVRIEAEAGNRAGDGRLRWDAPTGGITAEPSGASKFRGPTTDTSMFVRRQFTLTGTVNPGETLIFFLKPEGGNWAQYDVLLANPGETWELDFDLPQPDSIFFFMVLQETELSQDEFLMVPDAIMSQAAANIFIVQKFPSIASSDPNSATIIDCPGATVNLSADISNSGDGLLICDMQNTWVHGDRGFSLSSPTGDMNVIPAGSNTVNVQFTNPGGLTETDIYDTLLVVHNDIDKVSPWRVPFHVRLQPIVLEAWTKDFGQELSTDAGEAFEIGPICVNEVSEDYFELWNYSEFEMIIESATLSSETDKLEALIVGKTTIPANDSSLVLIKYNGKPAATDQLQTTLTFKIDECDSYDKQVDILCNLTETALVLIQDQPFETTRVGASSAQVVKVTTNSERGALVTPGDIGGLTPPFQILDPNKDIKPSLPRYITKNDTVNVTVTFSPQEDMSFSSTITVLSNTTDTTCYDQENLELTADAYLPDVGFLPIETDIVPYCTTKQLNTKIFNNNASEPLEVLTDPQLTGPACFVIEDKPAALPFTVNSGEQSNDYVVLFNPDQAEPGMHSATLSVTTDDPVDPILWTEIRAIKDTFNITISPFDIQFGNIPVPNSRSRELTITNNGLLALDIEDVVSNHTDLDIVPSTGEIAPGASMTFTMTLDVSAEITVDGKAYIAFDSPCLDTAWINYHGRGIVGELDYEPLDFGNVAYCQTVSRTFTITNMGEADVPIIDMEIWNTGNEGYSFADNGKVPTILSENESLTRVVVFDALSSPLGDNICDIVFNAELSGVTKPLHNQLIAYKDSGEVISSLNPLNGVVDVQLDEPISLENGPGRMPIIISDIYLKDDLPELTLDISNLMMPYQLNVGSPAEIEISCLTDQPDVHYLDTVIVECTIGACNYEYKIPIDFTAGRWGTLTLRLPDIVENEGKSGVKIPVYASVDNDEMIMFGAKFEANIRFRAGMFYPYQDYDWTREGDDRVLTFVADSVDIYTTESVIGYIEGSTLLPDAEYTDLIWEDFTWNGYNTYTYNNDFQNGSLTLKICKIVKHGEQDTTARLFSIGTPTGIKMGPNPAGSTIEMDVTVLYDGKYSIEIADLRGLSRTIKTWEVTNSDGEDYKIIYDTSQLASGTYYIILRGPTEIITAPLYIVK